MKACLFGGLSLYWTFDIIKEKIIDYQVFTKLFYIKLSKVLSFSLC